MNDKEARHAEAVELIKGNTDLESVRAIVRHTHLATEETTASEEKPAYKPNICPKCGQELVRESDEYSSSYFLREVYCENPECGFEGGIEYYTCVKEEGFTQEGACPKCFDPADEDNTWIDLEPYYLDEEEGFDGEHLYVVFKCPECGHKEEATVILHFDEFREGEKYQPFRLF